MECLLPYLSMVTVLHIMVRLERMLDYRGVGLARFHCMLCACLMLSVYTALQQRGGITFVACHFSPFQRVGRLGEGVEFSGPDDAVVSVGFFTLSFQPVARQRLTVIESNDPTLLQKARNGECDCI